MNRLALPLIITFFALATSNAEPWHKELDSLKSESYAVRKKAQETIEASILDENSNMEYSMIKLLNYYSHSTDPESKFRILNLMKKLAIPYKKSLGRTSVGLTFKSYFQSLKGVRTGMVYISKVQKDSPADKAGFKVRDKILTFDTVSFRDAHYNSDQVFDKTLDEYAPGEILTVKILRKDNIVNLTLTLGGGLKNKGNVKLLEKITQLKKPLKPSSKLPKSFDDHSFFARWAKIQFAQ